MHLIMELVVLLQARCAPSRCWAALVPTCKIVIPSKVRCGQTARALPSCCTATMAMGQRQRSGSPGPAPSTRRCVPCRTVVHRGAYFMSFTNGNRGRAPSAGVLAMQRYNMVDAYCAPSTGRFALVPYERCLA